MLFSAPARRSIARLSVGAAKSIGSTGTTSVAVSVTNATLRKAAATTTTTTTAQQQQQQQVPTKRAFSTAVRPRNTTTTTRTTTTRAARAAYYSQEAQGKGQKAGENKIWAFEEVGFFFSFFFFFPLVIFSFGRALGGGVLNESLGAKKKQKRGDLSGIWEPESDYDWEVPPGKSSDEERESYGDTRWKNEWKEE